MNTSLTLSLCTLALSLLPAAAQAQATTAHVEKAKIVGGNNLVVLYGLPALDPTTGKYKYWDTTITLQIDGTGKPTATSSTVSVKAARASSTEFVPGVYVNGSTSCNLLNSAFSGRTQLDLHCTFSNGATSDFTWFTGPITGHPWEGDLVAAGLNTLVGHDEYGWGKTMYAGGYVYVFGCFNPPELLSARQVGNTLTLVNYGADQVIDCQVVFTKQP